MRRRPVFKRDKNHAEIAKAFRDLGCSVLDLSGVASDSPENDGAPDMLIGLIGRCELVEVKQDGEVERPNQARFRRDWRGGDIITVRTVDDAYALVQSIRHEQNA